MRAHNWVIFLMVLDRGGPLVASFPSPPHLMRTTGWTVLWLGCRPQLGSPTSVLMLCQIVGCGHIASASVPLGGSHRPSSCHHNYSTGCWCGGADRGAWWSLNWGPSEGVEGTPDSGGATGVPHTLVRGHGWCLVGYRRLEAPCPGWPASVAPSGWQCL